MMTLPLADVGNLVEISATGLKIHPEITEEQSRHVFETIVRMDTSMDFIIGDWMRQHSDRFGRESMESILSQMEFDFVRAMRCEKSCAIEQHQRNPKLTTAHHHAVARNESDPEKQQEWLRTAEGKNLMPDELARSIRAGRIIKNSERNRDFAQDAGLPFSIEGISLKFLGWLKFVEANDPICDWDNRKIEGLVGMLMPMAQTYERLRGILNREKSRELH